MDRIFIDFDEDNDTVFDLKKKIYSKHGIPIEIKHLYIDDDVKTQLQDHFKASEYDLVK